MTEPQPPKIKLNVSMRFTPAATPVVASLSAQGYLDRAHQRLASGQRAEGLEDLLAAARLDPDNAEAHGMAGHLQLESRRFDDAERLLGRAVALTPEGSEQRRHVMILRAMSLVQLRRWSEAHALAVAASKSLERAPANVLGWLASVFFQINCSAAAERVARRGVELKPQSLLPRLDLAGAARDLGRLAEATEQYEAIVAEHPTSGEGWYSLLQLRRATDDDASRLAQAAAMRDVPVQERINLQFALFKALDDIDARADAWRALTEAHRLCQTVEPPWSADIEAQDHARIRAEYLGHPAAPFRPAEAGCAPALFIVGLPRSGTTVVERVLAAHSRVGALGETPVFARLYREATVEPSGDGTDWPALGQRYLQETAFLSHGAQVRLDKMPENLIFAGAIARAFPDAAIVVVRRDPMDSLFGAFRLRLARGWSRRQEDLAAHWRNTHGMLEFWRAELGERLVEVAYEDLVRSPETEIRNLVRRCGLAFEPACLQPERTPGVVNTSSSVQIRRPLGADRIGGWRRYEAELSPLSAALARAAL